MLEKVILRLIEVCKEKNIITKKVSLKNKNEMDSFIDVLSNKTCIPKLTYKKLFYGKYKTIRIDLLNIICKDLNIKMEYFFDSDLF